MRTNIQQRTGIPLRAFAMLLGVLLITGCAGGHVGESWQCPIAQGVACQSVSEADPAVGSAGEDLKTTLPSSGRSVETTGSTVLNDPLSRLMKLFRLDEEDDEEVATAEPLIVPQASDETPVEPNENFRTKERIARIWIAPYVDARNNYREGFWVRAVIRPAGWRLP